MKTGISAISDAAARPGPREAPRCKRAAAIGALLTAALSPAFSSQALSQPLSAGAAPQSTLDAVSPSSPGRDALSSRGQAAQTSTTALPPAVSSEESKIGKEGVKEVNKEYDVVKDLVETAKLQDIVATLEKASPYPDLHYTVTIVKAKHPTPEPEINAFSLPGGYIYVTKDLLNEIQSDDEIAAVLAHEMSHVTHHHVIRQIKQRSHDELISLLVVLGSLLAEGAQGSAGTAMVSQEVVQALQSPHSIHDETEADMSGIQYLYDSHRYSPVGMLTFMQRLALDERHHPEVELGYLQTHPSSIHRVEDIRAKLKSLGVPVTPEAVRAVTHSLVAVVEAASNGTSAVKMHGEEVAVFASGNGLTASQRAEAAAAAINQGLDAGRKIAELDVMNLAGGAAVTWEDDPLFVLSPADGKAFGQSPEALAERAVQVIRKVIWADYVAHS